ncbi:MAG: MFS transporter, partial [Thermoplasmata archaeon]|nr:MFS transporter [Thermoplasmata archaeon]NIS11613.1 MFS transporter [Thermoplasmata archaeon]NIS19532.1 MFS transporter [Thermoplasmata archaeon]NIT76101.1 MFS transporter [Thermoplasmata archaeon]NIU48648.1 MFS transporter [Thermoplasmata archaeon]
MGPDDEVHGGVEGAGAEGRAEEDASWYFRLVSSLYISTFAVRVSFAMVFIAFPVYLGDDIGYLEYALVLSTWPAVETVMVLLVGADIDRRGRRKALIASSGLAAVALAMFTLSDLPLWVAAVNGLMGVAAAGILVSSLALMADYAPEGTRGREMGVFQFVQIFGWLFGFAVGGVLVEVFDDGIWRVFMVASVLCAIAAAYAYLNVREPRVGRYVTEVLTWSHLVKVLTQRSVVLLVLPWFTVYLLIGSMFTFVFKASFEELALTGFQLTGLLLLGGGIILVTLVVFGHLSDRYGRIPVMAVGAVGMLCLMVTVGLLVTTAPEEGTDGELGEHFSSFIAPLAASAFLAGAFAPSALAALVDVSAQRRKGMTMGVYSFAISLAMAVGPIISGALIDTWGGWGYLAFLAGCGAVVLLFVGLRWLDTR